VTQPGSAKKQASRLAGVYKPRGAKKFPTCAQKRLPKAGPPKRAHQKPPRTGAEKAAANNNAGRRRS